MDWNVGADAYIRPQVDEGIDPYAIPLKLTKMCKQSIIKLLLPIAEFGQRAYLTEAVEKLGTKGTRRFRGKGKTAAKNASGA